MSKCRRDWDLGLCTFCVLVKRELLRNGDFRTKRVSPAGEIGNVRPVRWHRSADTDFIHGTAVNWVRCFQNKIMFLTEKTKTDFAHISILHIYWFEYLSNRECSRLICVQREIEIDSTSESEIKSESKREKLSHTQTMAAYYVQGVESVRSQRDFHKWTAPQWLSGSATGSALREF